MGCVHFESTDPWTRSIQENSIVDTSNTILLEHDNDGDGGIQEAWAGIENRGGNFGGGGGFFAGESRYNLKKRKSQVLLDGYALDDQDDLTRAKGGLYREYRIPSGSATVYDFGIRKPDSFRLLDVSNEFPVRLSLLFDFSSFRGLDFSSFPFCV